MRELRDEISSERIFQGPLDALCTNDIVYKMAVAGDNQIKIYNLASWKEIRNERIELPKSAGRVLKLQWANNGQLLVASTQKGHVYGFLTSIPSLTSTYRSLVAVLSSFTEITVYDTSKANPTNVTLITLESEPGFISLGQCHIAAGINNIVWYCVWLDQEKNAVIKGTDIAQ